MLPHIPQPFEFIHLKSVRDIPHLLLVLFLIAGISLGVYLALQPQLFIKHASEGSVIDLKFIPESIQVRSGQTYEAKIGINPKGQRVTAVKLLLSYDPQSVAIVSADNAGFLPVDLKKDDDLNGNLTLIYGSTIETHSVLPAMLTTIKFRSVNPFTSEIRVKVGSEVNVASTEDNVLNEFPKITIEPSDNSLKPGEQVVYPDNLLLEKAFFASSEPVVQDFKKSLEPPVQPGPDRINPEFSGKYLKQLGTDIFVTPIVSLNQLLEEKAADILGK